MEVGRDAGAEEAHLHEELFDRFFDRIPKEFAYEREMLRSRKKAIDPSANRMCAHACPEAEGTPLSHRRAKPP
jgi:hypothetical protein